MFTGIIEVIACVEKIEKIDSNIHFTMKCNFASELKIDQSVAHNGCCLTVVDINEDTYVVTAIEETLNKTELQDWEIGSEINVERCVKMGGRLDGHIVQGHVDTTGKIIKIENKEGSHLVTVSYDGQLGFVTVPQGSITVNGISLTVAKSRNNEFTVAIIPYSWEFTNMKHVEVEQKVNLEFDVIGKYVAKLMQINAV